MKPVLILILGLAVLAGCDRQKDRIPFDGKFFRTKVSKVDGQLDVISVNVRDAGQSIDGAREAGRHAAVSHCVENYGSSDIDWTLSPDAPADQLRIVDGSLIIQGTCPQ